MKGKFSKKTLAFIMTLAMIAGLLPAVMITAEAAADKIYFTEGAATYRVQRANPDGTGVENLYDSPAGTPEG
jgi:hypothetical protein